MDVQEVWATLEQHQGRAITGLKKIGCYGASYVYPMF